MMSPRLILTLRQVFLKNLYLQNFRNYAATEAHFSPGLNVFYGDNAQGKTNMLEAIYLIATGRSFRSQHLSELIQSEKPFFYLEAEIVRDGVTQKIKLTFDRQNRHLQMDANSYNSFHPLLGILPSVIYTTHDTELINGSPSMRRRFLNLHLAQSDPLYVHHLTRFWRAMKQRNCLLRNKTEASLDCWEAEMVQSAAYLMKARQAMIDELKEPLFKQGQKLSSAKEVYQLHLQFSQGKNYLQQLQNNRFREMALGLTLIGPHRDDLSFLIDHKPARLFASEGQKKTAIAALRFAEWERLTQQTGASALMGIDDLGLHLDEERQTLLNSALEKLGQVFVTTPQHALHQGHHIRIHGGSVAL